MPIWFFWWQGIENAPFIIKTCFYNILKNAGAHPVHLIDETNYQNFVSLPTHISEKYLNDTISVTHLSDYIRIKLLSEYGGLWIDGSIFVKNQIPEEVFQKPIWSIRNPGKEKTNVSNWDWTIGVMAGWKRNVLFTTVEQLLSNYWKDHDVPVDYFVMDYLMRIAYEGNEAIQNMINDILPNNEQFYFLQNSANLSLNRDVFENEMRSRNWLYKLSWKGNYAERTECGDITVYARWKQQYGIPGDEAIANEES